MLRTVLQRFSAWSRIILCGNPERDKGLHMSFKDADGFDRVRINLCPAMLRLPVSQGLVAVAKELYQGSETK